MCKLLWFINGLFKRNSLGRQIDLAIWPIIEEDALLLRHDIENMHKWSSTMIKKITVLLLLVISGAAPTMATPGSPSELGLTFRSLRGLDVGGAGSLQCANVTACSDCVDAVESINGNMVQCVWCGK